MPYLTCPQCHAECHTGLLYNEHESCPRCGASFHPSRGCFRDHLRSAVFRRRVGSQAPVDWETITGAQYACRQYVTRSKPEPKPDPARQPSKHAA
jgi:hypothetical protein